MEKWYKLMALNYSSAYWYVSPDHSKPLSWGPAIKLQELGLLQKLPSWLGM